MPEIDPLKRATDPHQYDLSDINWEKPDVGTPRNSMLKEYLDKYMVSWRGKSVLDIGSGSGWLLEEALRAGAKRVAGIEPSMKSLILSKNLFPHISVTNVSFEDYQNHSGEKFDVALSIWTVCHMASVDLLFEKTSSLLNQHGELIIIVPDFEYYKLPRSDYKIEIRTIDSNQYVSEITRPGEGVLADIVRKNSVYVEAAQSQGLQLIEEIGMVPTENYIRIAPRYENFKNVPISQLLRFVLGATPVPGPDLPSPSA